MGRASLEKTSEESEEQETYFIISAVSIFTNLLCHFFYPFEVAKTGKTNMASLSAVGESDLPNIS